jgi:hypothetical protein
MSEEVARRRPGRPPRPPVSDEPIGEIDAFFRLRSRGLAGLDSFQAMRTLAFCSRWQRVGGGVGAVVETRRYGRSTAFSRLKECHAAGFEPGCVQFRYGGERWEVMEAEGVRHMQDAFDEDLARAARRPWLLRKILPDPRPHPDLE